MGRRRAALLTAAYYATLFSAVAAFLPYWPVWLADWGLGQAQIGVYLGLGMAVRVVAATVLPTLADRYAARRAMLAWGGLAGAGLYLLHLGVTGEPALIAVTLALAVAMGPLVPVGEALGVRAAATHGFAYAHVRAVGSIAFLVMTIVVGALVAAFGSDTVLWVAVLSLVLSAGFGAVHPGGGAPPGTPTLAGAGAGPLAAPAVPVPSDRARIGEAWALMRHAAFVAFVGAVALGTSSHAVYYAYSTLEWGQAGIAPGLIGWLWAVGVAAETALMLGPGRGIVARIGPARALAISGGAGVLRWGLMMGTPGLVWLWPIQCLHALTFSLGHLGAMAFVAAAVPPRMAASAQGLCTGGIAGLCFALATPLGGAINAGFGPGAAYGLAAAMAAGSAACALVLARTWGGGRLAA